MKLGKFNGEARRNLARFSSMTIQMGIIIALFAYIGQWLDNKYQTSNPWFTVILSLLGIVASLYLMLKEFGKKIK